MSDEEKEEKNEEKNEKKKDGTFSKWWNKTKNTVASTILESNLEPQFNKEHTRFEVYTYGSFFGGYGVYGDLNGNTLLYWGDKDFPEFSVVINADTGKAYYAGPSNHDGKVTVSYDGTEYERKGTLIVLDENVEEVSVIKADDRYFIFKGEKKKN